MFLSLSLFLMFIFECGGGGAGTEREGERGPQAGSKLVSASPMQGLKSPKLDAEPTEPPRSPCFSFL